jgi:excisionase family DNA binding protein
MPEAQRPRLQSVNEIANFLGITRLHAYTLARRGELPSVRVGRYVRFDPVEIERWQANGGTAKRS